MSMESILAKELEKERTKNELLEFEVIRLAGIVRDYQENEIYPPSINACIRDVNTFLNQLRKLKA